MSENINNDSIGYVSLHNHTSFSILDSLIEVKDLFIKTKELGQTAVAITDHGTMGAMWGALQASKDTGVKLIAGCEHYFVDDLSNTDARLSHFILLAKNAKGYENLLKLTAEGYDNYIVSFKRSIPRIDWSILEKYSEGLICTTACANGILGQLINQKKFDEAISRAKRLKDIFGDDLAIELQPHALKRTQNAYSGEIDQISTNKRLRKIAEDLDIKCIVATNAHYIEKEHKEAHDVLLAISAGAPVKSGMRLQYEGADLHMKSETEVLEKLARISYDRDFAIECIKNTKYFADKCEFPDWIDPKFSNPSGKELPSFPVKDQSDYNEFLNWMKGKSNLENKEEDECYLRYLCEINLAKKIPEANHKQYLERLEEELDVLEYHKFSSYMLIVHDYLAWARRKYQVGYGRGCVTKGTKVLTNSGYKNIEDITISDKVWSHTGNLRDVNLTFKYPVKEDLLSIKTDKSFGNITFTKDHKVYGTKSVDVAPDWISIGEMNVGDYIAMPFLRRANEYFNHTYDLSKYNTGFYEEIEGDDNLYYSSFDKDLNMRGVAKKLGIHHSCVRNVVLGKGSKHKDTILKYFDDNNIKNDNFIIKKKILKYILIDSDILYLLGRWVGDGSINSAKTGVVISFNSNDTVGYNKITKIIDKLGWSRSTSFSKVSNSFNLTITNMLVCSWFIDLFPDYKNSSKTKSFPKFWRKLSNSQITDLLYGYFDADGTINRNRMESIKTVSNKLALETKEALQYIEIISGVHCEKDPIRNGNVTQSAYKNSFVGLNLKYIKKTPMYSNGWLCKIRSIDTVKDDFVYDIEVDKDHSYVTTNYAVHNSVGGSLVAYLTDIHVANPIKYGLIFARFHNKQKKSFPDIDSDFCSSGKEAVTEYIKQKYGKDQVASVTNMNRMTPKVYVKSIARSFVYGGDRKTAVQVGNALADTIPADIPNMRLAFENAALFNEYTKPISEGGAGYTEVKKYHEHIAGKLAALSTHAGGLIIGKRSLKGLIPLRKDKEGNISIEFEKNGAEELGLVKMDILGVKTLEIVRKTHELIKETTGSSISYPDFEEYDEKTYKLLSDGNTFCVFQLGTSDGTIDLCQKIKPKCLEDISIINSLARPSSRDIRSEFISVKNGEREVKILHESLNAAFKPTFGFGLYEESLLQLARDVAGWDYHEADKLRKLTKEKGKNPEKVKQWRQEFIDDSVNNDIPKNIATRIWDETISAFSGYGFNKSHSILYSILSYHTAWLKAHYPLQFLVCNLQSEIEANSKDSKINISKIKEEIRSLGVNILPPDVNISDISYKIIDKDTILTGLDALKFMGKDAIPNIIENRPYSNFDEFLTKINGRSVNIRSIQALVASGCLGSFGLSRKLMYLYSADYKKKLQSFIVNNKKNPEKYPSFSYPWPKMDDWTLAEKCALEKFYLGESLSGNKIKQFNGFFTGGAPSFKNLVKLLPRPTANITESQLRKYNKKVTLLQGEIINIREFKIKKEDSKLLGMIMAHLTVEDPFGNNILVTFFPEGWVAFQNRFRNLSSNKFKLEVGCGMYFNGNLNWYNDELSIIYEDLVKVCSVPPLPKDLESKKISLKKEPKLKKPSEDDLDRNVLLEELENELINSGNTDLDDDD